MTATDIRRTLTLLEAANRPMTDTPEFRAWFRNSKIVDRNGDPLVVYHGTHAEPFDEFQVRAVSQDAGIYFTPDSGYASDYAIGRPGTSDDHGRLRSGSRVIPCFLSIKTPLYCLMKPTERRLGLGDREAFTLKCILHLYGKGHDGLVVGIADHEIAQGRKTNEDASEIVAFSGSQVRSVFSFAPAAETV